MKRRLLAICLGTIAAGAAQAQTSVTLYGIGDGNFRVDHTAIGTLKSVGSGGESGTRWGLRGTEDLGGGLKAVFNFEQGVDISDNSVPQGNIGSQEIAGQTQSSTGSRLFSRTATVGLSSAQAGDILFGRAYTPFYATWIAIDPMAGGFAGGAQNFATPGGSVTRYDNAVYYNSPKFYGVQVTSAYSFGESTQSNATVAKSGLNTGNVSVTYASGPVLAAVSFLSAKNTPDNNTRRAVFAGAAYDFGVVKLDAMYFHNKDQATLRVQTYGVGATVPVGAWNFYGQVARIDNKYDLNNSPLKFNDALFVGLGTNYSFSKRTDVYASWARQNNRGNAINVVTDASNAGLQTTAGATANVTPGFDPWSAQLGVRLKF